MSLCVKISVCKSFCVYRLLCVKVPVCKSCCVYVCVYICVNIFLCMCLCLRAYQYILLYNIPCLSLATKTLTSSYLLFLTSTHTEHIHMISNNIPCLSLATKTLTSSYLLFLTSTHTEHIHMISNNILMNIFMQIFGIYLNIYIFIRSRASHRLIMEKKKNIKKKIYISFIKYIKSWNRNKGWVWGGDLNLFFRLLLRLGHNKPPITGYIKINPHKQLFFNFLFIQYNK